MTETFRAEKMQGDPEAQAALAEVVVEAENLIEALLEAAEVVSDPMGSRMAGWVHPIEALRNDAKRVAGSSARARL